MNKINLQIVIEQIRGGMYSYDDMVEIIRAIIEGCELGYPEYNSLAGKLIRGLKETIERWDKS